MKKDDKIKSWLCVAIFGTCYLGLVSFVDFVFEEKTDESAKQSEISKPHNNQFDKIKEIKYKIAGIKEGIEDLKVYDASADPVAKIKITNVEDKITKVEGLMTENINEGQLYSKRSIIALGKKTIDLERAYKELQGGL